VKQLRAKPPRAEGETPVVAGEWFWTSTLNVPGIFSAGAASGLSAIVGAFSGGDNGEQQAQVLQFEERQCARQLRAHQKAWSQVLNADNRAWRIDYKKLYTTTKYWQRQDNSCHKSLDKCNEIRSKDEQNLAACQADDKNQRKYRFACEKSLTTCQSNYTTCSNALERAQDSLDKCNEIRSKDEQNLAACQADDKNQRKYRFACEKSLTKCQSNYTTCSNALERAQDIIGDLRKKLAACLKGGQKCKPQEGCV
jgi:predicted secreted protein